MGYTTEFKGRFALDRVLLPEHAAYLKAFSSTRRVTRDPRIIGYNSPPRGQPGLWCQWVPSEYGVAIEWNGTEKFYNYLEWLQYIIKHFLSPWGYTLNGTVEFQGERHDDFGEIRVVDNKVTLIEGERTLDPQPSIKSKTSALEALKKL